MDKPIFLESLKELEKIFRREYDDAEKNALVKDVLRGYHPSLSEWQEVVRRLRIAEERFEVLPTVSKVISAMKAVRREIRDLHGDLAKTDCKDCLGAGVLWSEIPYPAAGGTYKVVVPCGCTNTPAWVLKGTKTARTLLSERLLSSDRLVNVNHERLVDTYSQF